MNQSCSFKWKKALHCKQCLQQLCQKNNIDTVYISSRTQQVNLNADAAHQSAEHQHTRTLIVKRSLTAL